MILKKSIVGFTKYVRVKYKTKLAQGIRGRNWQYTVVRSYTIQKGLTIIKDIHCKL